MPERSHEGINGPIERYNRQNGKFLGYWVCKFCPLANTSGNAKDGRRRCSDEAITGCNITYSGATPYTTGSPKKIT